MTQVLFGQSYYLRFDPKLYAAMRPFPPLGTLYAASFLRSHDYAVAVFDAMLAASERDWERALEMHQPKFVVLYKDSFNYLSKMCLLQMRCVVFEMIHLARTHHCTVIVSGSDATDHLTEYDALPFPARDLVDVSHYRRLWQTRHRYFAMNLVTTRGCPYYCNWCAKPIYGQRYNWCAKPIYGQRYNSRSADNVVVEMRALKETY